MLENLERSDIEWSSDRDLSAGLNVAKKHNYKDKDDIIKMFEKEFTSRVCRKSNHNSR